MIVDDLIFELIILIDNRCDPQLFPDGNNRGVRSQNTGLSSLRSRRVFGGGPTGGRIKGEKSGREKGQAPALGYTLSKKYLFKSIVHFKSFNDIV
jgi:hypothetical protein